MGHLLLNTVCFEQLCNKTLAERDAAINDFIDAITQANYFSDRTYIESNLGTYAFPFGNFYNDFAYSEWENFKTIPCFNGIKQATYQNLTNLFYANPNGSHVFQNLAAFVAHFSGQHYGFSGISYVCVLKPYVSCVTSWYDWHINFLQQHPNLINWDGVEDHCLTNKKYSDLYLAQQYNPNTDLQNDEEIVENAKTYCDSFPLPNIDRNEHRAIARNLGREIARRNFFVENESLSNKEKALQGGDERLIFESVKNGHRIYMSIDFHKCNCYELCDHKGRHLGEYRFDGILNSPADSTGKHDIKALSQ